VSFYDAANTMGMNQLKIVMLVVALSVASSRQLFPLRTGQWMEASGGAFFEALRYKP
jgi:hypothetical protein